jgi:hypothetical protein
MTQQAAPKTAHPVQTGVAKLRVFVVISREECFSDSPEDRRAAEGHLQIIPALEDKTHDM